VDNELEVIRHQMEEKRASLADKLEALESTVRETVQEATAEVSNIVQEVKSTVDSVTDGVQETVESVKDTLTEGVQETVDTVKQTLNLNDHIRRRPWTSMGVAVAAGWAAGYFFGPRSFPESWESWRRPETPAEPAWTPPANRFAEAPAAAAQAAPSAQESTFGPALSAMEDAGKEALKKVGELAVGTLMGVIGQVAANSLPPFLKDEANKLIKDLTPKLGGKVLDLSHVFANAGEEGRNDRERSGVRPNGREG